MNAPLVTPARCSNERFFILGCPRSGTTLLQVALNRHPKILVPPETKFFYYFYRMPVWMRRRQLDRINDDLSISLSASLANRSADSDSALESMLEAFRDATGKISASHLGEKTPEHTARIERIRRVYPDAPIFFLYRDGRDVALSLTRVPWIRCNLLAGIAVWLRYYRELVKWRDIGDPNIHFIRFEDLIQYPKREFSSLLDVLGLEYEPEVVSGAGDQ